MSTKNKAPIHVDGAFVTLRHFGKRKLSRALVHLKHDTEMNLKHVS